MAKYRGRDMLLVTTIVHAYCDQGGQRRELIACRSPRPIDDNGKTKNLKHKYTWWITAWRPRAALNFQWSMNIVRVVILWREVRREEKKRRKERWKELWTADIAAILPYGPMYKAACLYTVNVYHSALFAKLCAVDLDLKYRYSSRTLHLAV